MLAQGKHDQAQRYSRRKPVGPAIECWFWAGFFSLAGILLVMYRLSKAELPSIDAFHEFNLARIADFAASSAAHKVVMLGNSGLKYATASETDLAAISAGNGLEIAYLRIVHNAAEFADFERFLDPILALRPNIILLQAPLYVRDRVNHLDLRMLQNLALWSLRGEEGLWNPLGIDQAGLQYGVPCTRDFSAADLRDRIERAHEHGTYATDGRNAVAAKAFIERAHSGGTDVIALAIPRTRPLTEALHDFYGERLIVEHVLSDRSRSWVYPGTIPDDQFCDLTHMDVGGRNRFSRWLALKLVDRLSN